MLSKKNGPRDPLYSMAPDPQEHIILQGLHTNLTALWETKS